MADDISKDLERFDGAFKPTRAGKAQTGNGQPDAQAGNANPWRAKARGGPRTVKMGDSIPPGDYFDAVVLPRLTADLVFTWKGHNWHQSPGKWRGSCPWHESESGTSFYTDLDRLVWRCPACQVGCGPIQYVYLLRRGVTAGACRGQDFLDVLRELCNLAGVPFPERMLTDEQREHFRRLETRRALLETVYAVCAAGLATAPAEIHAWLSTRGLGAEDALELGLGLYPDVAHLRRRLTALGCSADTAAESAVVSGDLAGYVVVPWRDDRGRALTLYGRWPAQRPPEGKPKTLALRNPLSGGEAWEATKRSPLYLDRALAAGHRNFVLVEGVLDAAVAQARGDTRVIACVGAELTHEQTNTLARRGAGAVTIALDPDQAGDNGVSSCVRQLRDAGITPYVAPRLPEGMDPDEFILAHGIDAWREHVSKAVHGYRHEARRVIAGVESPPGDQRNDAVVKAALAFVKRLPADRDDELLRHFWPEIAPAVKGDPETLHRRARQQEPTGKGSKDFKDSQDHGKGTPGADTPPPEWGPPVPLDAPHPVPAFPVSVFPAPLRRFVNEAAWATNAPPDFVGVPLLVAAGACLGNCRHLAVTRTHRQPPILFAAIVGPPASAKSPAIKHVDRPLRAKQREWHKEWTAAVAAWENQSPDERGPKPVLRRCLVDDFTFESLKSVLSENPKGVTGVVEELAGLFTGLNQYKGGRGNDRQTLLKLWDGRQILSDRKKGNKDGTPELIERPLVGLVGGIQPEVVRSMRGEEGRWAPPPDDGGVDRFLFGWPDDLPAIGELWRDVSEDAERAWKKTVDWLLEMKYGASGPDPVSLTACGRKAWEEATHRHAAELNDPDFLPHLRGPWGKLVAGYLGRLALILHVLRQAWGEVGDKEVDGESVRRAELLVNYFKGHARRAYVAMQADRKVADARYVLRWLQRHPDPAVFTVSTVQQALKNHRNLGKTEAVEACLEVLEQYGYVRRLPEKPGPGRPTRRYERNPLDAGNPEYPGNPPSQDVGREDFQDIQDFQHREGEGNEVSDDGPTDPDRGDAWEPPDADDGIEL